jgi:hypothetical protein
MRNTIYYLKHQFTQGASTIRFVVLSSGDVTIQFHRIVGDKMEPLGKVKQYGREMAAWHWGEYVKNGWHRWIPQ